MRDQVDHLALTLDLAAHAYHRCAEHRPPVRLEHLGPDDEIGDVGLVLERDEHHTLGRTRLLADEHDSGEFDVAPVPDGLQRLAGDHPPRRQLVAQERKRMGAQAQARGAIILDHLGTVTHWRQDHLRLDRFLPQLAIVRVGRRKQGKGSIAEPFDVPQSLPSTRADRPEPVRVADPVERPAPDAGTTLDLLDARIRVIAACGDDRGGIRVGQVARHSQTEADRLVPPVADLQRAVPAARIDVHRADLDAVLAGIAHDLRGGVEAHRLGVEQRRAERVGMMAFHPRRGVGDQREARGVAFGKAVGAKPLDLLEGLLGKVALVAARDHTLYQLPSKMRDAAGQLEGRHRPPEQVCLGRGEPRTLDRDPHRLLLEQWHAQRLLEHAAQLGGRVGHFLLPVAAAAIGVDHVALDRSGPDDRDLDDKIVERARRHQRD